MAVKDVFRPSVTNPSDPKKPKDEKEKDPIEEAQKLTRTMAANAIISSTVAEAEARTAKARAEARSAEAGGDPGGQSGIKIEPYRIDIGKQLEEGKVELTRLKEEADTSAKSVGQENMILRDKIHEQEIKVLQITFQSQMDMLTRLIEANASRGSFSEQYQAAMETAKQLGFAAPSQSSSDLMGQIELQKINFEQTLELKRMSREEKRADREFQRQLRNDESERDFQRGEAARQERRDKMFADAPKTIGSMIAKGMIESATDGEIAEDAPRVQQQYVASVPPGKAAEMDCPNCNNPIGIGPTAKEAVCAGCGAKVSIKRVESEAPVVEG